MGKELIVLTDEGTAGLVNEGETPNIFLVFADGNDAPLAAASFTTLTVTQSYNGTAYARDGEDISGDLVDAKRIDFSSGSENPTYGDTVDGATSGASGTFLFAKLTSGSWNDGDAVGELYLKSVTGTFSSSENLDINGGTSGVATTTAAPKTRVVSVLKLTTTDTAWQKGASSTDETESHMLDYAWTWSDTDSDTRTGRQLAKYVVKRSPTT